MANTTLVLYLRMHDGMLLKNICLSYRNRDCGTHPVALPTNQTNLLTDSILITSKEEVIDRY